MNGKKILSGSFFSFKFWVARVDGGLFSFFLCSQHVPSSSQWVLIK